MRFWLAGLAVVVVGVGLLFWRAGVAVPSTRPLETQSDPEPVLPPPPTAREGVTLAQPEVRIEPDVPAGNATAMAPVESALEDRGPGPTADPIFEAQYVGWSVARMDKKIEALELAFLADADALFAKRFETGMYRVVDANEISSLDESFDVLSEFDAQGLLTRSKAVQRDPSGLEATEEGEEEPRFDYQIATLPPDVHPELYRLRAELDWLRATVATRRASGGNSR